MNAMVLAAGRGTRLAELDLGVPKALVQIGGEPLLARQLRYLHANGVRRVVVNAHHLSEAIESFAAEYRSEGGRPELIVLVEAELLGTAGGVRNALGELGEDAFVVLYGDVLFEEPLEALVREHRERGALATLAVYESDSLHGKGLISVDDSGRITGFIEHGEFEPGARGLVNAGLYVIEPALLATLESGIAADFGHDVFPAALARGEQLAVHLLAAPVLDVGTPADLARARRPLSSRLAVSEQPAPTTVPTDASVVICAYALERWEELVRAVRSALEQTRPPREVVVAVDNNPALLERAGRELQGARVVANDQRAGLAGARNSGALATSAPVVAFLDDDACADPDWLEQLLEPYARAEVLGVGGSIRPDWSGPRPDWFPEEFLWTVGCSYRGLPTEPAAVRNMIGANMSVRREVMVELGGFREDLGRLEETDFCIRGQQRHPEGIWLYWPAAGVTHSVSEARASWSYFRARCFNEGVAKASMVVGTGSRAGLESERRYTRRVLPAGVARALGATLRGDLAGAARAGAIVAGLALTASGFARGRLALRRGVGDGAIPRRGATP